MSPVYNKTEDGWIIYNDTQYFVNHDKLAMEDAREACRQKNGELVVITGEDERKFLWRQAGGTLNPSSNEEDPNTMSALVCILGESRSLLLHVRPLTGRYGYSQVRV